MRLHIFVDGSWLFGACKNVLAAKTESPNEPFKLDFGKLRAAILAHVQQHSPRCTCQGDAFLSTSIFNLPTDFETWPETYPDITSEMARRTQVAVRAREAFVSNAAEAGFSQDAVFRPTIKPFNVVQLAAGKYREKQVDTAVVALLVTHAITLPADYHVVLTGDADILPGVRVVYPQYTKNVVIATSHPDELRAENRQASFSFSDFVFEIPPFYLQEHAHEILQGSYVYRCAECSKVFARWDRPVPTKSQPFCVGCRTKREVYAR